MNKLPDRWLPYLSLGQRIKGTRFIPFKVPLNDAICRQLQPYERFTPSMLLQQCSQLGLVVDLTNTNRYYDKKEIEAHGVKYEKIFCPGKVIPAASIVQNFIDIVDSFLRSKRAKPDSLIGVHCTHGLNRTAYFICSYMIQRMNFPPQEAIKAFERARGHRIERQEYVQDLLGKSAPLPLPPNSSDHGKRRAHHNHYQHPRPKSSPVDNLSVAPDPMKRSHSNRAHPSRPDSFNRDSQFNNRTNNSDKRKDMHTLSHSENMSQISNWGIGVGFAMPQQHNNVVYSTLKASSSREGYNFSRHSASRPLGHLDADNSAILKGNGGNSKPLHHDGAEGNARRVPSFANHPGFPKALHIQSSTRAGNTATASRTSRHNNANMNCRQPVSTDIVRAPESVNRRVPYAQNNYNSSRSLQYKKTNTGNSRPNESTEKHMARPPAHVWKHNSKRGLVQHRDSAPVHYDPLSNR